MARCHADSRPILQQHYRRVWWLRSYRLRSCHVSSIVRALEPIIGNYLVRSATVPNPLPCSCSAPGWLHLGMVIVAAATLVAVLVLAVVLAGLLMLGMAVLMRMLSVVHVRRRSADGFLLLHAEPGRREPRLRKRSFRSSVSPSLQQHAGSTAAASRPFCFLRSCCAQRCQLEDICGTDSNRPASTRSRV